MESSEGGNGEGEGGCEELPKENKERIVKWGETYKRASCGNQGMNSFLEEGMNLLLPV